MASEPQPPIQVDLGSPMFIIPPPLLSLGNQLRGGSSMIDVFCSLLQIELLIKMKVSILVSTLVFGSLVVVVVGVLGHGGF